MRNVFDELRLVGVLSICEECGDGDEDHPIDPENGECVRHGGWSISKARQLVFSVMDQFVDWEATAALKAKDKADS